MATQAKTYGLELSGNVLSIVANSENGFFDPRFLVAALLDHVAHGDGSVSEVESETMLALVSDHFSLDETATRSRLAHALNLYAGSMDLAEVGRVLREILTPAEREEVMLMMLRVVAADGRQGADELRAIDEVVACLELTEEERHAAFQRYFASSEQ
ncbi:hypothetical protein EY643_12500 [Halioglobus maricola]|uniref:Co-chaperone DjlA N-terminal domain-containing protein n=1 Tax=Halioglobus maricola TaxID=2601894 RepID=A0A5P9NLN8_9GAMM|nr:TerB family tellurite resistance protein [Halioglobus maricola]QFU76416.1 hypothetical protein EY643_12500 [Halioglobus maricola]